MIKISFLYPHWQVRLHITFKNGTKEVGCATGLCWLEKTAQKQVNEWNKDTKESGADTELIYAFYARID